MQSNILGKRHGQVKAQSQIAVALLEAVNLLFGLTAALGKQNLGIFDGRGVQRRKAVQTVSGAKDLYHSLKLHLLSGQKLHKTGQSPGFDSFHKITSVN